MNARSVLSQLLQWIPRHEFEIGVNAYGGDKRARHLKSWGQFVALLFGQLTGHSSLRAIVAGLRSARSKLYHMGIVFEICRSTLADANDHRDARIFEAAYYRLLPKVQALAPGHSECRDTNRTRGIMADQTIMLKGIKGREYEGKLRGVSYREPGTGHWYVFVTNRFDLSAATICDLYKARWEVELFFKVLKSHLQVRKFAGTSVNAVKAQIWVALIAYLLMMAVRFQAKLGWGTPSIMAVLTVMLFSNKELKSIWDDAPKERCVKSQQTQLLLFST